MPKHPALTCKKGTLVRMVECPSGAPGTIVHCKARILSQKLSGFLIQILDGPAKGNEYGALPKRLVLLDSAFSRLKRLINE